MGECIDVIILAESQTIQTQPDVPTELSNNEQVMWFEILPSFMIISIATSVPGYALYGLHKWKLGNAYRRGMEQQFDRHMYRRDYRLTGNPYQQNSLETITGDPEPEKGGKGKKK